MTGIYCRVSTGMQDLSEQERRGLKFDPKGRVYKESKSGGTIDRPELQRLIADIEAGEIDSVWVIEISRLSRDVEDSAFLKKLFVKHRIRLYVNDNLTDVRDINQSFLYNVQAAISEFERSQLRERITRGIRARNAAGGRVYPRVYGYRLVYEANGSTHWEVHTEEAAIVRTIFSLAKQGKSQYEIVRWLNDKGVPRRTGKAWRIKTVSNILARPIYRGLAATETGLIPNSLYPRLL